MIFRLLVLVVALGAVLLVAQTKTADAALIEGTNQNDTLRGTPNRDTMRGFRGPDIFFPKGGHDHVYGGRSHDHVHAYADGIRDYIDCGKGSTDDALVDPRDVTKNCENILRRGGGWGAKALTEGAETSGGVVDIPAALSVSADIVPRWLICNALHDCHNPAPKPIRSMLPECNWHNDGMVQHEWDQRLGTFVPWECKCYTHVDGCHWIRRPLEHRAALPWWPPHRRYVLDARRACKSIVCKTIWVRVRYPTRNIGW